MRITNLFAPHLIGEQMQYRFVFALIILAGIFQSQGANAQTPFRDCPFCPEMVLIPAGAFTMGATKAENVREESPERYIGWESPLHSVTIPRAFAVGVGEVTRGEFARFIDETRHVISGCDIANGNNWDSRPDKSWRDPGFAQDETHPVVCVNWADAKAYADWLARATGKPYRLLSEAEWEYMARAGTATARFWGDGRDDACRFANVPDMTNAATTGNAKDTFRCADGHVYTSPVKSFQPNAFGVYDSIGNVWEWVDDCFHDSYVDAPTDSSSWEPHNECLYHVARGGSWNPRLPTQLRSAARGRVTSTLRNSNLGFRVAVTP